LLLAFLVPNYQDFGMQAPAPANPFADYFYLGLPALTALLLLLASRPLPRAVYPAIAILLFCVIMVTNPLNLPGLLIQQSTILEDICRDRYFLLGIPVAFALLTAVTMNRFLDSVITIRQTWFAWAVLAGIAVWIGVAIAYWAGPGLPFGWSGVAVAVVPLLLFAFGLHLLRSQAGRGRTIMTAALLVLLAINYKVFGTSKRFDAAAGAGPSYSSETYVAMDNEAYEELRAHAHDRILLDDTGPLPGRLRHVGLLTPQGWDPFLSRQFRGVIEASGHFRNDREFYIDPSNSAAMQVMAVHYVITAEQGSLYSQVANNPRFRLIGSDRWFYRVYEYVDWSPAYRWNSGRAGDAAEVTLTWWTPEQRSFRVKSQTRGRLTLVEQSHPGWSATVDGNAVRVDQAEGAFQAVNVEPGNHTVVFEFHQNRLATGIVVTMVASFMLLFWIYLDRQHSCAPQ
jgi:hypothetical protein